jgi:hypothetical protein
VLSESDTERAAIRGWRVDITDGSVGPDTERRVLRSAGIKTRGTAGIWINSKPCVGKGGPARGEETAGGNWWPVGSLAVTDATCGTSELRTKSADNENRWCASDLSEAMSWRLPCVSANLPRELRRTQVRRERFSCWSAVRPSLSTSCCSMTEAMEEI